MRRLLPTLMLLAAHTAAAQLPPSINKPIEMARKNANATNAQMGAPPIAAPQQAKPAGAAPAKAQATKPVAAPVTQAKPVAKPATKPADPKPVPQSAETKVAFTREVFAYVSEGRRDPFASPIETGEIRPLLSDLRVVGIIFDPSGRNSVAVMRDMSTQQQYRVKGGQILGRAKVAQIKPQEVVMTIDEYGFSRQEILRLNVQTQQTKGKP